MSLEDLPPLRDALADAGLLARKSFGQHFLLDLNLTAKIARAAGPITDCAVIEVGPGPGGLTRAILEAGAAKLIAIERDERCIAALQPLIAVGEGRLAIVEADALEIDAVGQLAARRAAMSAAIRSAAIRLLALATPVPAMLKAVP